MSRKHTLSKIRLTVKAKTPCFRNGRLCAYFWPFPAGCTTQPKGKVMSETTRLSNHLRPRREKLFGPARGIPLDGNAKARLKAYVQDYNARYRQEGQHRGAITPAFMAQ
jgi:hypothetical protein